MSNLRDNWDDESYEAESDIASEKQALDESVISNEHISRNPFNPFEDLSRLKNSDTPVADTFNEYLSDTFPLAAAEFRHGNSVYLAAKAAKQRLILSDSSDSDIDLNEKLDEAGIPEEAKHRFEHVKNQKQFDDAIESYGQDSADKRTLENAGWIHRLTTGLMVGLTDPINYVPWAKPFQALKLMKYGSTVTNAVVTAGIATGLNASIRMKVNNELDAFDVATEFAAGAVVGGVFHSAVSSLTNSVQSALKYAVNTIDSSFKLNADGTLITESYGRFGTAVHKANRIVWEMFNNAPASQMRNSGDPVISEMAGDVFGDRHQNLKGNGVVGIAADERLDMFYRKEAEIAESKVKSMEAFVSEGHGTAEDFNEAISQVRANTYVDINTGELHFGRLPEGEQLSWVEEPKIEKASQKVQEEFRFYDEEHIKNIKLSSTYEPVVMSDNPHVLSAAKEEIEFWREIIKRAKDSKTLDNTFGEGGISVKRNVLKTEDAGLTSEEALAKSITLEESEKTNIVALGHIIRKYNQEAIYENIGELKALLYREILLENGTLAPNEITKIVNGIIPKLTGNSIQERSNAFSDLRAKVSFTKEREIAIHDSLLLQSGFLEKNSLATGLGLWRPLLMESELDIIALNKGHTSWDTLKKDYHVRSIQKVGAVSGNKQTAEITGEVHRYNYKLLCDVESLLKGSYGSGANPAVQSFMANAKGLAYAAFGGKIFLSMIPDLAGLVLHGGISTKTLTSFIGSVRNELIPSLAKNKNGIKLLDSMIQRNRFIDLGFTADRNSAAKITRKVGELNDKVTFVTHYNKILKSSACELIYSDVIEECLKKNPNKDKLNLFGITENYRIAIAEAFGKFGEKSDSGLHSLPIENLDREIQDQLKCSLQTSVDQIIMTPRAGNVPRYLRSQYGSLLFMFSTYPYMLYNNLVSPMIKGSLKNKHAWSAMMTSVGLSMLRKEISDPVDGKETERGTLHYWKEVADYSYIGTHFMNIPLQAFDAFRGTYNRGNSDIAGSAFVPVKFANDIFGIMNSLCKGKVPYKKIRNMTPLINAWEFRPLTNHYFKKERLI